MSDPDAPGQAVPSAVAEPASRRISAVWLVPLLALVISLGVAWRTYSDRGPLIEIGFQDASGIEAGQTTVRFRSVTVGVVEEIGFSPDLRSVIATVRIDKDVAQFVDESAEFWVVRPSVTAQGVTGIETVLSGVYIEAFWDDTVGERVETFTGLPRPPLTPADQPGRRVRVRAPDGGSTSVGAPVLFKRIPVGQIEAVELTGEGDVMLDIFVDAPNHLRLTEGTRFWNASGFSVELGLGGASLNVESLVSLLQGGIAFDTVGSSTEPVGAGHVYELYGSESAARENTFIEAASDRLLVDVYFDGSVRGLAPGASVEFRGIKVGEVTSLQAAIQPRAEDAGGGDLVTLRTTLALAPERLGISAAAGDAAEAAALDLLEGEVERGLRARLASGNILSQSLYVDLGMVPDAVPASLDRAGAPHPVLPSAPSDTSGLAASAEGVMQRLQALPIEDLVDAATTLLANVNSLVSDESVRAAPENLGLLLADVRRLVADDAIQQAPAQLAAVLASAREIVEQVESEQVVENVVGALEATRVAVASFGTAADGLPDLLAEIEAVAARARQLPLEDLVASGTRVVDRVDAFVASDGVTQLPVTLDAALAEVRLLLEALREGGAVENANATLLSLRELSEDLDAARLTESLQTVVTEARLAVGNVNAATAELPRLIDSLGSFSDRAGALPLEEVVASAQRVLDSADGFLAADGVQDVPASLNAALDEVRAILTELSDGGAITNLNATLASADTAATSISAAVEDLPALIARLSAVADQADAALVSVSPGSELNRDTTLLLREVRDAARAVNALVTALERRPNSVLFGR